MIRGTSAVLLPLNGPLSSGYTGTRAFLNPNIRGGQESHKSHSRSGWNTIRGQGLLPKEGLQPLPSLSSFTGGSARQELGGSQRCEAEAGCREHVLFH